MGYKPFIKGKKKQMPKSTNPNTLNSHSYYPVSLNQTQFDCQSFKILKNLLSYKEGVNIFSAIELLWIKVHHK